MENGTNRLLDGLSKMVTNATGAAQGLTREVEMVVRSQTEQLVNRLDLVQKEQLEVLKDMLTKLANEQEQLKLRIEALEKRL